MVVFYWSQPFQVGWVGWVFSCSIGKKPFSVGLVVQLFQPASNLVETVEKETTENGWKSILLENVNRFNLIWFRLKRLIPVEHDLCVVLKKWEQAIKKALIYIYPSLLLGLPLHSLL